MNQAIILAVMRALSGNRAGVQLEQELVRYWTYAFRIHSLEENPVDVMEALVADEIEAMA